jgi:hypothetical protein
MTGVGAPKVVPGGRLYQKEGDRLTRRPCDPAGVPAGDGDWWFADRAGTLVATGHPLWKPRVGRRFSPSQVAEVLKLRKP